MKLFVPGRICLFGEHSDWAGGHRRTNGDLAKGYTIITGTNQGLYAEVKPHPSKLIIRATLDDRTKQGPFEIPMQREALLAAAEEGGFASYAAGVAYQVLTHYTVRGLEIDNYRTTLPVKKGLSSSAAVCVLVARAFNRIYDLKMTVRGEMEYAYQGEITTPSRCGRMDQGCAYGSRPVLMTYDGDRLDVAEVNLSTTLHFVIVDLCAGKDTRKILADLNRAYPFADDDTQRGVQEYLGPINKRIVQQACEALQRGDAEALGQLMTEAQAEFDRHLGPACPSQLTAPVLHKLLNHKPLQPLILGGKGVGSQGDGTAQLLVRDAEAQDSVIEIIERDLKMNCMKLAIESGRRVRKAVIPAAGFGTRMFPATKAVKKELFPVIDSDGRAKPVILAVVEEAVRSGIEEVCLVVQSDDVAMFEEFFAAPPAIQHYNKLPKQAQEYCQRLMDLSHHITLIPQDTQDGFGHAVWCAREWVGDEPFLLMLGDHLFASNNDVPCSRQLIDVYERVGKSAVGLMTTPAEQVHLFGCVSGVWEERGSVLSISDFYEKPDADYARQHLVVDDVPADHFLSLFGMYVLEPRVFELLDEAITNNLRERGEFQLTSALDKLRRETGFSGLLVNGKRFDIGVPDAYRQTVVEFGRTTP